jgi:hypothetical protein
MDGQTKCVLFVYFLQQSIQQIEKFLTILQTLPQKTFSRCMCVTHSSP